MNKSRLFLNAVFILLLAAAIIVLSGSIVLRVSGMYGFYFNDIQASDYVDSSLNNSELAAEITGYFNSFDDEEFQIYEKNGVFLDPVFDSSEVLVMKKAKALLLWILIGGAVLMISAIAFYIYLRLTGEKRPLRVTGIVACAVTIIAQIAKCILIKNAGIRASLYSRFIGVELNEEATLRILLGSPIENVYLVFSSIAVVIIVMLFLYIHLGLTKEKGMFKEF